MSGLCSTSVGERRVSASRRMRRRLRLPRARARQGGGVYLLVLATSSLVAIVGISGLLAARLERGATELEADAVVAASIASAGLVAARAQLGLGPAAPADGTAWGPEVALGEGAYRLRVTALGDRPGVHRVRVRATAGEAVRVLLAEVAMGAELGPELLRNPDFQAGLHPTENHGAGDPRIEVLDASAERFVRVSQRSNAGVGIEQRLAFEPNANATHRLLCRLRQPDGPGVVTLGLVRPTVILPATSSFMVNAGEDFASVSADLDIPSGMINTRLRCFVRTEGNTDDLDIAGWSLREVLRPQPAQGVPGSRAWVADDGALP